MSLIAAIVLLLGGSCQVFTDGSGSECILTTHSVVVDVWLDAGDGKDSASLLWIGP
jgi:hypothetical protein